MSNMTLGQTATRGRASGGGATVDRSSLRLSACLLLAGQILFIVITQFHAGGDANHHTAIFAEYARDGIWTVVHLGQFTSMAILLAGLLVLFSALDIQAGATNWTCRFGTVSAAATLALYGVLQAVDGVALKQAVNAWASAPEAEKAVRFASAEAIRWLEWGVRSYQNFALGIALLLLGAAMARSAWIPRPMAYLAALSGLTYFAQGLVGSTQGFSPTQSVAIVLAWVLSLVWMIWLVIVASRSQETVVSRGITQAPGA